MTAPGRLDVEWLPIGLVAGQSALLLDGINGQHSLLAILVCEVKAL
jgi:hypothetical protein